MDDPSPNTSSVTPWRTSLRARPSAMSDGIAHESTLMKPGATARPETSISRRPRSPMVGITAEIKSASIATSAVYGGPPSPSYTIPPRMTTSCIGRPYYGRDDADGRPGRRTAVAFPRARLLRDLLLRFPRAGRRQRLVALARRPHRVYLPN